MMTLSNGRVLKYMVASGALGFDGKGWFWERLLLWFGLIKPELFAVTLKTLTFLPRRGNLQWWNPLTWLPFSPWSCVRFLPGGVINKVGLSNPGIDWWLMKVAPTIDFKKQSIIVSIFDDSEDQVDRLTIMLIELNEFDLTAIEVNYSCPNTGKRMASAEGFVNLMKMLKRKSRHPLIAKVSVAQDYLGIAEGLRGIAEAIALNSVPHDIVFGPESKSPMSKVGRDKGKGGVSGKPAQKKNWAAVVELAAQGALPVIAPSIMEYGDMNHVRKLGAQAVSFGAIHLPDHPVWAKPWTIFTNPCKPTTFVQVEMSEDNQ